MTSATKPIIIFIVLLHLQLQLQLFPLMALVVTAEPVPVPATWAHQFHSVLFINSTGSLHKVDLWYDWPNGRNFNIIQHQLGELKYDLEWNNGTSFYYTLEPFNKTCKVMHFDVGILRPNWLDGANYLGQENIDNFLCNVWEKVDFILYYEDVLTHRPVKWIFLTSGMTAHVMTYEVGAVLEDPNWQAPAYCFGEDDITENSRNSSSLLEPESAANGGFHGALMMRGMAHTADAK